MNIIPRNNLKQYYTGKVSLKELRITLKWIRKWLGPWELSLVNGDTDETIVRNWS